jgi:hypothetical protein
VRENAAPKKGRHFRHVPNASQRDSPHHYRQWIAIPQTHPMVLMVELV